MRLRWLPLITALLLGCDSTPEGGADAPTPVVERGARAEPGVLLARDLLPVRAGQVFWYEATLRPSPEASPHVREAALFAAWDRDFGLHLESLGLESSLRFLPKKQPDKRKDLLYVLPAGLNERGYMLDLRARTKNLRTVKTPAGTFEAITLRHEEDGVEIEHCFAKGVGLVRYVLSLGGTELLRLELVEQLVQGPAPGYTCDTPAKFWKAYEHALRRLDVETLEELIAPRMRERLQWPASDEVSGLGGPDPDVLSGARADTNRVGLLVERIRLLIPELLDVQLSVTGPWVVKPGSELHTATAKGILVAWLDGRREVGPITIVLERPADQAAWQLADFYR